MKLKFWLENLLCRLIGRTDEDYRLTHEIDIQMGYKIINTTMRHIMAIHAVEKESFSVPWPLTSLREEIKHPQSICLVAADDKKTILGHIMMRRVLDEGHIHNIAVAVHARRQGVGRRLLETAISKASAMGVTSITLEVRSQNHAAISLYEKLGFVSCGLRKNYYHKPTDDALVMVNEVNANTFASMVKQKIETH